MKRKITRRDFLKLAGAGAAVTAALGYGVLRESNGDPIVERNPYVNPNSLFTAELDGSVPILVVVNPEAENKFGIFLTEILRAEGVNCFHMAALSSLSADAIGAYDVILLAETPLTTSQIELFEGYVFNGGGLVSLKPAAGFESMFGWERSAGSLSDEYLLYDSAQPVNGGSNPMSLQYHGTADLYELTSGEGVAWLFTKNAPYGKPAIVMNRFGKGAAVAYAFDLARSIAYMRQGNPELVNQDLDGLNGARTVDMFVGRIDLERIQIPQADEQQRMLVNVLAHLSKRPLPRLWYFPEDKKSVLIATGDSHSNPVPFIEEVLKIVDDRGGHMTVYYAPQIVGDIGRAARRTRFWLTDNVPVISNALGEEFGSPTPDLVESWRARGHEIALHPYVETGLDEWQVYWKEFTGRGYGPVSQTVRTHRVLWSGWMETARAQAMYGMRMNFDYYHVGPSLQMPNGAWVNGHLTGSGRPMKFIDEQGHIIDLYQQLTQVTDEHNIPMNVPEWGGYAGLSAQETVDISKYLLDRSVKYGDYCAITGQFHVDPFQLGGDPARSGRIFLEGTLDYANELGVPILSAQEWLWFSDARHDSNFENVTWDAAASSLTCELVPPAQPLSTLTVLLPALHAGKQLSAVTVDGVPTPAKTRLVLGGVEYAQVILPASRHSIQSTYS